MRPVSTRFSPFRLAALNFGIQLVWGAILAVSLQARSIELGRGHEIAAFALLAALGAALAAVTQIVAGRLADRRQHRGRGRSIFYLTGVLGAVPFIFWLYLAPSLPQLFAAFFGLQILLNIAGGPYQAAIPDFAPPQRRGITSSWMSALQSIGAAAGLLIAGFIHILTYVASLLSAGLVASLALTVHHARTLEIQPPAAETQIWSRNLRILLFSRGCINTGFYILLDFLLFFVRDTLNVTPPAAAQMDTALLFLSFTLAAVGGAAAAARPADAMDLRRLISITGAVTVVALMVLAAAFGLGISFAAAIVAGVAWGAFVTADWALACTLLPKSAMATAMGIWNIATVVPQIFAPLLAAPLVLYGNSLTPGAGPRLAMAAAAAAFVAGTAWIWRLPRTKTAPA